MENPKVDHSEHEAPEVGGGFVRLYRNLRDSFVWPKGRAFTKFEALVDLLMDARYADGPDTVLVGKRWYDCHRGDLLRSQQKLAERWGWSKSSVGDFLRELKGAGLIRTTNEGRLTRIRIVDFNRYNGTLGVENCRTTFGRPSDDSRTTSGRLSSEGETSCANPPDDSRTTFGEPSEHKEKGEGEN